MDIKYTSDSTDTLREYRYKKKYRDIEKYEKSFDDKHRHSHQRRADDHPLDEYTTSALSYEDFAKRPLLTSPQSKSEYQNSNKYRHKESYKRHVPVADYDYHNREDSGRKRSRLTKHPKYDDLAYDIPTRDVYYQFENDKERLKKTAKYQSSKRDYDYNRYSYEEPEIDYNFEEDFSRDQVESKSLKKYKHKEKYDEDRKHKKSRAESQNKKGKDYHVFAYKDANFHERGFKIKDKGSLKKSHKPKLSENAITAPKAIDNNGSNEIEIRNIEYPVLGFKDKTSSESKSDMVYLPVIVYDKQLKSHEGSEKTKSTTPNKNIQIYAANLQDQKNIFETLKNNTDQISQNTTNNKNNMVNLEPSVSESKKLIKDRSSKETQTEESTNKFIPDLSSHQNTPSISSYLLNQPDIKQNKMKNYSSNGTKINSRISPKINNNSLTYQNNSIIDSGKRSLSKGTNSKTVPNNIISYNTINMNNTSHLQDNFPVTKDYIKVSDNNSLSMARYNVLSRLKPQNTIAHTELSINSKIKKNESGDRYSNSLKYKLIDTTENKEDSAVPDRYSQKHATNYGMRTQKDSKHFSPVHDITSNKNSIITRENIQNSQKYPPTNSKENYSAMKKNISNQQYSPMYSMATENTSIPLQMNRQSESQKYQSMDSKVRDLKNNSFAVESYLVSQNDKPAHGIRYDNNNGSYVVTNHNDQQDEFIVKAIPETVNLSSSGVKLNQNESNRRYINEQNLLFNVQHSNEKRSKDYSVMPLQSQALQIFAATTSRKSNIGQADIASDNTSKISKTSKVSRIRHLKGVPSEETSKTTSEEALKQFTHEVFPEYEEAELLKEASTEHQKHPSVARRKSKSVVGRKSKSVVGRKSKSVVGRKSKSVVGRESKSLVGRKSKPSIGRKSKSTTQRKNESEIDQKNKSISREHKGSIQDIEQEVAEVDSEDSRYYLNSVPSIKERKSIQPDRQSKMKSSVKPIERVPTIRQSILSPERKQRESYKSVQSDSYGKNKKSIVDESAPVSRKSRRGGLSGFFSRRKSSVKKYDSLQPSRKSKAKQSTDVSQKSLVNKESTPERRKSKGGLSGFFSRSKSKARRDDNLEQPRKSKAKESFVGSNKSIVENEPVPEAQKSKKGVSRFFSRSKSTAKHDDNLEPSRDSRPYESTISSKQSVVEKEPVSQHRKSKKGISGFFSRTKSKVTYNDNLRPSRKSKVKESSDRSKESLHNSKISPENKSYAESVSQTRSKTKIWSILKPSKSKERKDSRSLLSSHSQKENKNRPSYHEEDQVKADQRKDNETSSQQEKDQVKSDQSKENETNSQQEKDSHTRKAETHTDKSSEGEKSQETNPSNKEQQCQCLTKYITQARDCSNFFLGPTLHQQVMSILKVM